MNIFVDSRQVFNFTDMQKRVIYDAIPEELFAEDMERRIKWVLLEIYNQSFKKLKEQWEPILSQRVGAIPTNQEQFCRLVFSQPDYKSRRDRDQGASESKAGA